MLLLLLELLAAAQQTIVCRLILAPSAYTASLSPNITRVLVIQNCCYVLFHLSYVKDAFVGKNELHSCHSLLFVGIECKKLYNEKINMLRVLVLAVNPSKPDTSW
jgi:hypothetical protein